MRKDNDMRRKRKGTKLNVVLVMTLVSLCLAACAPTDKESVAVTEEESEKIQIGFSMDSFLIERWQRDRDVFVSKAQELGAEVNVQNANGVVEEQISQIEYFIEKNVDVIVVVAIDGDTLTEVVEKAKKSGIKVIAYDRLIHNADVDLYISFDNEKVGSLMATYLKKAVGNDATLIRILGSPADSNVEMADNGFNSVIEDTNITVDVKEYADGWLAET